MKKLLFLVAAAVAGASAFAGKGVPGMYQKIYSGSDVTAGDPADGGDIIAAGAGLLAVKAGNSSISYTDPKTSTTYTLGANQTVAYKGVMFMEAGKTYTFVKGFDDTGHIRITSPDGSVTKAVLDHTSWAGTAYGSFTSKEAGYYTLLIYCGNGTGGVGPASAPFTSDPYAGIMWNDVGLTTCTADNKSQWHRLINGEDGLGTYLYTAVPIGCTCELTRTGNASYKIAAVYSGVRSSSVKAVARAANDDRIETSEVVMDEGDEKDFPLDGFKAGTSYEISLEFDMDGVKVSQKVACVFTGEVSIEAGKDADEASGRAGTFTVALSGGAVAASDFEVLYAVSDESTAVAGRTYVALPGKVTIPSGANAATIRVQPLVDESIAEDLTLCLDLVESECYVVSESAASATISVIDGEFAGWKYDAALGQVSDGEWIFSATLKEGTAELTIGAVIDDPGEGATLDFTKSIVDGNLALCTLVALNPNFSAYANRANLVKLLLPSEGLTTIGNDAFRTCTALTEVSPYLPDSVTTLGTGAFYGVPAAQDLRLNSVESVSGGAFYGSGITSVYFGPAFKTVHGGWGWGSFGNCASLTNITFDPRIDGAYISGEERHFGSCPALEGTLDLSCFTKLCGGVQGRDIGVFDGSPKVTKVILGENLKHFSLGTFCEGTRGLTEVVFKGPPPIFYQSCDTVVTEGDPFRCVPNGAALTTYVPKEYAAEWGAYAKGGVVDDGSSLWDIKWVRSAEVQPLRPLIYKDDSGDGDLGVWIYDMDALTLTDGNWVFAASNFGNYLAVGAAISVASGPTNLDFTARTTNTKGKEFVITSLSTDFEHADAAVRQSVAQLMIPLTVTTIGTGAFRGCTALTNIVNYLSDAVTSIGDGAFYNVPAHQDLRLNSIASVPAGAFYCSGITSVYFGPAFKTVHGGWNWGAFWACTSMTNITFDSQITNAYIVGEERQFSGCTALEGTLDLRCFTKLRPGVQQRNIGLFDNSPKVTKVILGENLTELSLGTFCEGTRGLQEVVFMGPPPTLYHSSDAIVTEGDPFGAVKTGTLTTWVMRKHKKEWAAFAHEGVVRHKGTHWKTDFISDGMEISQRPLLGADFVDGLMLIVK